MIPCTSREKCWLVRVLVVLCTSTKSIGDGGEEPFVLMVFIQDRRLTSDRELSPRT